MKRHPFNNLPKLDKEEALNILKKTKDETKYSSDLYKAVFHLANYPCEDTEIALIDFIKLDYKDLEFNIARRKAIEVLASFGCDKAIPLIAGFLKSEDSFLVETAVWALGKLRCKDIHIIDHISSILYTTFNNQRVVIQTLTNLGVLKEIKKIRSLSKDQKLSNGVRGAALASLVRLADEKDQLNELKNFLKLSNQNDRHCAVQDIINAGEISMIPFLLKAPVSPAFKIKAIDSLWIDTSFEVDNINVINSLDSVLLDNPNEINTLDINNFKIDIDSLINQLFHTDFNRCYRSIQELQKYPSEEVLSYLNDNWDRARGDYGAIYFFINLYKLLLKKGFYDKDLLKKIDFLLSDNWPDYMKFKSLSIQLLSLIDDVRFFGEIKNLSDEKYTPYWINRYTALLALENKKIKNIKDLSKLFINDRHRLVRLKAELICDK